MTALTMAKAVSKLLAEDTAVAVDTELAVEAPLALKVENLDAARLFVYLKGGNAGCAAKVTLGFEGSPDGSNWFAMEDTLAVGPMSGTAEVLVSHPLDLRGLQYLRLATISNPETDAGYTATVNAWLSNARR